MRGSHALLVGQYVGIPESQHVIALCGERGITRAVLAIIRMLPTIDFYDEPFLATNEINDVGSDGLLPDEFKTAQPSVAQREPQLRFSVGGLTAKASL